MISSGHPSPKLSRLFFNSLLSIETDDIARVAADVDRRMRQPRYIRSEALGPSIT